MRLLIVLDTYLPATNSAAVQMHDLAREFARQGHEPTVLAPRHDLPGLWTTEERDGVRALHVRAPQAKDRGYARRVLAEAALPWILNHGFRRSPLVHESWEGVVWYSPSIFLGPIVRRLKRRYRMKSYLILRDLFPDWAADLEILSRGAAFRILKRIERSQYLAADTIGVQSAGNIPLVKNTIGRVRRPPRIEVLENWWDGTPSTASSAVPLLPPRFQGRRILVYAGNLGKAQGVGILLTLARALKGRDDAGLLFVGRGEDMPLLREAVSRESLDHVEILDAVAPEAVPGFLARCHIGLVVLDPRHRTHNVPGKYLSYLVAGLPVLAALNPNNDIIETIRSRDLGRACSSARPEEFVALAQELLDLPQERLAEMGRRGRAWAEEHHTVHRTVAQIAHALSHPS
jgi:glycosyltransferase involved in cell wall biosynthesis